MWHSKRTSSAVGTRKNVRKISSRIRIAIIDDTWSLHKQIFRHLKWSNFDWRNSKVPPEKYLMSFNWISFGCFVMQDYFHLDCFNCTRPFVISFPLTKKNIFNFSTTSTHTHSFLYLPSPWFNLIRMMMMINRHVKIASMRSRWKGNSLNFFSSADY